MTNLTDDEHNQDWLNALQNDAHQFADVINRVESLGILAVEHIRRHDLSSALDKLAQMGEGIRLCKQLVGVK